MGIDIDSYLMIGLPYDDLTEAIEKKKEEVLAQWLKDHPQVVEDYENDVDAILDDYGIFNDFYDLHLGLTRISPHYDCEDRYCLFGITVNAYGNTVDEVTANLLVAEKEFKQNTGIDGKVYQSPCVW